MCTQICCRHVYIYCIFSYRLRARSVDKIDNSYDSFNVTKVTQVISFNWPFSVVVRRRLTIFFILASS